LPYLIACSERYYERGLGLTYDRDKKLAVAQKRKRQENGLALCWEFLVLSDCSVEDFKETFDALIEKQALPFSDIQMQSARELRGELDGTRRIGGQENLLAKLKNDRKKRKSKNEIRARIFGFNIAEDDRTLQLLILFHTASNYCCRYWLEFIDNDVIKENVIHFQKHLRFKADSLLITQKKLSGLDSLSLKNKQGERSITILRQINTIYENNNVYPIEIERTKFKKLVDKYVTYFQQRHGQHLVRRRKEFESLSIERGYYMDFNTLEFMTSKSNLNPDIPDISNFLKTLPFENLDETNWADMYEIKELINKQLGEHQAQAFWNQIIPPVTHPRMAFYPPL
jgi:hypothetical protein